MTNFGLSRGSLYAIGSKIRRQTDEALAEVLPNMALHLTAYSLRAYGAPASGSR
jgi:hypothetical protein